MKNSKKQKQKSSPKVDPRVRFVVWSRFGIALIFSAYVLIITVTRFKKLIHRDNIFFTKIIIINPNSLVYISDVTTEEIVPSAHSDTKKA